jgi:hypothetical protein
MIAIISFTHKLNSKLNTDFLMVLKTNRVKKPVQFLWQTNQKKDQVL